MKKIIYNLLSALLIILSSCHTNKIDHGTEGMLQQTASFPTPSGTDAVDLGLSVNWAPYNIGASSSSDYGNFYAYSETEFKTEYSSSTYTGISDIESTPISHTNNDIATVKWGDGWRIPTAEEVNELIDKCSWKESRVGGVNGMLITGPSGNSIFLPASGICAGRIFEDTDIYGHYMYDLSGSAGNPERWFNSSDIHYGMSVRAVQHREFKKAASILEAIENYKEGEEYSVTGKITDIVDSLSCVFYIQDGTAALLINGLRKNDVSTKNGADTSSLAGFGLKIGYIVTIVGEITEVDGVVQMKDPYCEETNDYPSVADAKILSVEEQVRSMYNQADSSVKYSFRISASTSNENIIEWGYRLFKNDDEVQTFKSDKAGTLTNDIELVIPRDGFTIDYNNYKAISKDIWSVGVYAVTEAGDIETEKIYRTVLDTDYKRKPRIYFTDLIQGEDEDPDPNTAYVKLNYVAHYDGALFMDRVTYYSNDNNTGIYNTASDTNHTPGQPQYGGGHYFRYSKGIVADVYTWYLIESNGRKSAMDNCILVKYHADGSMSSTITDYPYNYNPDNSGHEGEGDEENDGSGNEGEDGGGEIETPQDSTATGNEEIMASLCSFTEVDPKMYKTSDSSVHHKFEVKLAVKGDNITQCGYKVYKDGVEFKVFKSGYVADTVPNTEILNIVKSDYNIDYETYTAMPSFKLTVAAYCMTESDYYETPEEERYEIDLKYDAKPQIYFTNLKYDITPDSTGTNYYVSMSYIGNIRGGLFMDEVSYYNNDDDTGHNNDMSDNNYDINNPPYSGSHSFSYMKGSILNFYTWYLIRCRDKTFPMDNCVLVVTDADGNVYPTITDGPYNYKGNDYHGGGSGDSE